MNADRRAPVDKSDNPEGEEARGGRPIFTSEQSDTGPRCPSLPFCKHFANGS
jgi:hypothetical protein